MIRRLVAMVLLALAPVACTSDEGAGPAGVGTEAATVTSATSTSIVGTTTSTSTTSSTTSTSSPTTSTLPADFLGEQVIGTSAGGLPITVSHRGTPGGTVVLVVGVIHGDENAGLAVLDELRTMALPHGIDLWLMEAMNPDGYAADVRGNANGVDLNRNFPHDWTPIAEPGDWQYSGAGPASEPETQAFIDFTEGLRPALTLWYHQDLYRVSPSDGPDGPLRRLYTEITGLPYETVSGGTYSGVAATWVRRSIPGAMSFIIELGPTLSVDEAVVHAGAVLAVAQKLL